MPTKLLTQSPIDGKTILQRLVTPVDQVEAGIALAFDTQKLWKLRSIAQRAEYCHKAINYFEKYNKEIAEEITLQMGRPIRYSMGEIKGMAERARYMIDIATQHLNDIIVSPDKQKTNKRFIRPTPLGVVVTIAPWNYPLLTAVNSIIPALMAGNTVLLKHSQQTPLCAERFARAFEYAGLPEHVFQYFHLDHSTTKKLIQHPKVALVSFTGSVKAGRSIEKMVAGNFIHLSLELGGKDPAYIRSDANIKSAAENLVDGAFFNSGQSCCGIERIYAHEDIFEDFIRQFIAQVKRHKLGDPMLPNTTLGPLINTASANFVREQISQAITLGATPHINENDFCMKGKPDNYVYPQVLTNVNHQMDLMRVENFGPLVGIMSVNNDQQAVNLMNDSQYGLTASIWTNDPNAAISLGDQLETGTVFMNRCDYLDPALAWTGVKNSGRGCSLSHLGYQQLTRPKSFNLNLE